MKYIYIDESGDIGRKSKYIVFAAVITENDRQLEKAVKKVWRAKPQYHKKGRLHSVEVDDATRIRILSVISDLDITIKFHVFKKAASLPDQHKQYYAELSKFVANYVKDHIIIVERKDTLKKRNEIIHRCSLESIFKKVIFADPHNYKQLQAVDFIAWSYGRVIEQKDDSFYKIIEEKCFN
ncbi:DUF3800 domain-containing protein [Patescibacteria group bacterium]|nr:MAG: DUF3800 domain-containing protein [Patescibacteria group bacterium]